MRKALFICIALLIAVTACQRKPEAPKLTPLEQIDSLISRQNSFEARKRIQALTPDEVPTEGDSAYLAVLKIELGKSEVTRFQGDDSSLVRAIAFYEREKNDRMVIRTAHLLGHLLYNKGREEERYAYFLKALKLGVQQEDITESLAHIIGESAKTFIPDEVDSLQPYTLNISNRKPKEALKDTLGLESMLLHALQKVSHKEWEVQAGILSSLQDYYAATGDKKRSLEYAHRNVALRKPNKERAFADQSFLANSYERVGEMDSAAYYRAKSDSLRALYPLQLPLVGDNRADEGHSNFLLWGVIGLLVAGGIGFFLFYKKRMAHSERRLKKQEKELQQARQEVERLTPEADVFVKIGQIIEHHLRTAHSTFRMEKSDWHQLLVETNKRYPGVVDEWQHHYGLNEEELRVACLHLTDFPVTHLGYVMGYSRVSIYRKSKDVVRKLGGDESVALRDFLKKTFVKHD